MGLKTTCDGCGRTVLGIISSLREVKGKHLCSDCATNPESTVKYFCNSCNNFTPTAQLKGNSWIEVVLYLCYIIPGIIYSIWRRVGPPNVCPICKSATLVPAALAKPRGSLSNVVKREEKECPHCAEIILVKAKICKHCRNVV